MRRLVVLAAALALAPPTLAALPRVDARAFLVADGTTGELLVRHDAREQVPIASLTKLMTVLVTLEHARPDDVVTVAPEAASIGESTVNLHAGEQLTVRDLLKAALIQSANDAAVALAAHVGRGSVTKFVEMMNARARRLGLTDTHFARPDGLDASGHYSSARDMTVLARYVMRRPLVRRIVRERADAIAGGRTVHTWNDLLYSFPGLIGVKTGHTSSAGWSEVAAVRRGGVTVYATLLGSPDRSTRNAELAALLEWGLRRYARVPAIVAGRPYAHAQVGYGRRSVDLVAERTVSAVGRRDRQFVEVVTAPAVARLPVKARERLGSVRVYQHGRLVARSPLVASRSVSRPGLGGRIGWYAGRTAHHVWSWVT